MANKGKVKTNRYMIALNKWRSVVALCACSVTLICTAVAIGSSIILYARGDSKVGELFRYFTTLSNIITALAAAFIIPYAINGIRSRRFIYPKWMSRLHYTGTICTTLTFVFAMAFILPVNRTMAIEGNNLFLHVICPLAVLISFQMVEVNYSYTKKDMFLCIIPIVIYTFVYLVMVVFIGAGKGGWDDLYSITDYVSPYIALPGIWVLALIVAFLIRTTANFVIRKRQEYMLSSFADRDLDPVEIKIEVFGLGRLYGQKDDDDDLTVHYDILDTLAKKYDLDIYDLINIYSKGLIDGVKEKAESVK